MATLTTILKKPSAKKSVQPINWVITNIITKTYTFNDGEYTVNIPDKLYDQFTLINNPRFEKKCDKIHCNIQRFTQIVNLFSQHKFQINPNEILELLKTVDYMSVFDIPEISNSLDTLFCMYLASYSHAELYEDRDDSYDFDILFIDNNRYYKSIFKIIKFIDEEGLWDKFPLYLQVINSSGIEDITIIPRDIPMKVLKLFNWVDDTGSVHDRNPDDSRLIKFIDFMIKPYLIKINHDEENCMTIMTPIEFCETYIDPILQKLCIFFEDNSKPDLDDNVYKLNNMVIILIIYIRILKSGEGSVEWPYSKRHDILAHISKTYLDDLANDGRASYRTHDYFDNAFTIYNELYGKVFDIDKIRLGGSCQFIYEAKYTSDIENIILSLTDTSLKFDYTNTNMVYAIIEINKKKASRGIKRKLKNETNDGS
jgi:hypothetical protein